MVGMAEKPHCYRCGEIIAGNSVAVHATKPPRDARPDPPESSVYQTDDGYVFLFCSDHTPPAARVQ